MSIDVETTGLDTQHNELLAIGIVIDEHQKSLEDLEKIYIVFDKDTLRYCDVFALAMNADLLRDMKNKCVTTPLPPRTLVKFKKEEEVTRYLQDIFLAYGATPENKITLAGKNIGKFDYHFLRHLPWWKEKCEPLINHRFVDLGSLFWNPFASKVPDLIGCKNLCYITDPVSHNAVDDALDVVKCIRAKFAPEKVGQDVK